MFVSSSSSFVKKADLVVIIALLYLISLFISYKGKTLRNWTYALSLQLCPFMILIGWEHKNCKPTRTKKMTRDLIV